MNKNKFNLYLFVILVLATTSYSNDSYQQNYNNDTVKTSSLNKSKVFVREYIYNASEDDSKNSSRKKSIKQLKSILSEEVGTHIESSLDMKTTTKNGVSNKYVKSEINSLSANITKLKILDEKWNGTTYYIKASVKIDEEQTMMLLVEAIKAKASKKDVKRLNKILKEQNGHLDKSYSKIQKLQKKLVLQEIKNQASKSELTDTKVLLQNLQREKQKYDNKIIKQKSEIGRIRKLVIKAESRIKKDNKKACLLTKGMTKKEIINAIGKPTSDNWSDPDNQYMNIDDRNSKKWYYGSIQVDFNNNLISAIRGCR